MRHLFRLLPFLGLIFLFLFQNCKTDTRAPHTDEIAFDYNEKYRPQFHFSPKANWMNDPNGLVYNNGQWHLFYQHNPWGNRWGHMSWGHAVTRDLYRWGHMPIAIYEEENEQDSDSTMIFSGSAVVDKGNRSGLCPPETDNCMVAFYTGHVHNNLKEIKQNQSLAFSSDGGQTWTKYEKNPILDIGEKDFRDPKVFWHEQTKKWVMLVNLPKEYKVLFYGSDDLINWEKMSEFGGVGDISQIWECPDLFELRVENEPGVRKWVLALSGGGASEGYHGMFYFVGQFDGQKFTLDEGETGSHYLDYGKDFYAAVTWNNDPYRRRLMIGWMNNWAYANDIPTAPWKSSMSLVRQLSLMKTEAGYLVNQIPVRGYESLRGKRNLEQNVILPIHYRMFDRLQTESGEIQAVIALTDTIAKKPFGLKVFQSRDSTGHVLEETSIGYDPVKEVLYIDRTQSGNTDFHPRFSGRSEAPLKLQDGKLTLHVFIDKSLIEVYANRGIVTMSEQVFPNLNQGRVELFAEGNAEVVAESFAVWQYNSAWED